MNVEINEGQYLHHLARYALIQDLIPGSRIFLLGGGGDAGAELLLGLGAQKVVVGVSPGRMPLDMTQVPQAGHPVIHREVDPENLPFEAGTFDLVFAFEVMAQSPRLGPVLAELRRIQASDGLSILSIPDALRDDLREMAGDGELRFGYRSPADVQHAIQRHYRHCTPLAQRLVFGYSLETPATDARRRTTEWDRSLVDRQLEPPLFHLWLASDLDIVLDEDRFIQLPTGLLVSRIQEGLRLYHRVVERKNSAVLEMLDELRLLRQSLERVDEEAGLHRQQLSRVIHRLEALKGELTSTGGEPSDARDRLGRFAERLTDLLAGLPPLEGERRSSKLVGRDDAGLRVLAQQAGEDVVFHEDVAPFRLPGPVPFSRTLQRDLIELRHLLNDRDARLLELNQWREGLHARVGALHARLKEDLASKHTPWQIRERALEGWAELEAFITEAPLAEAVEADTAPEPEFDLATFGGESDRHELFHALRSLQSESPEDEGPQADTRDAELALRERHLADQLEKLNARTKALDDRQALLETRWAEADAAGILPATPAPESVPPARNAVLAVQLPPDESEARLWALEIELGAVLERERLLQAQLAQVRQQHAQEIHAWESAYNGLELQLPTLPPERVPASPAGLEALASHVQSSLEHAAGERAHLETQLADRDGLLAERSAAVLMLEQALSEKDARARERELAQKDAVSTLQEVQDALARSTQAREALSSVGQSQAAAIRALETERAQWLREREVLVGDLNTLKQTQESVAQDLHADLERTRQRLGVLETELETTRATLTSADEELRTAREALAQAVAQDSQRLEHQAELEAQRASLQTALAEAGDAANALREALAQKDAAHAELEAALARASEQPDQVAELQAQIEQLSAALEEARTGSDARMMSAQEALRETREQLEAARGATEVLAKEYESARATLTETVAHTESFQEQLAASAQALEEARANLNELTEKQARAEEQLAARESLVAELEARIQALYQQRETLEAAANVARDEAAREMQAAAQVDILRTELEELRESLAARGRELDTVRQEQMPPEQLESLKRRAALAEELELTNASLTERLASMDGSLSHADGSLSTRVAELERLIAERDEELARLKEEVQRSWRRSLSGDAPEGGFESGSGTPAPRAAGEDLTGRLTEVANRVASLERELEERSGVVTRLRKELELKSTHNRSLQEIVGRQRDDLDKIKGKIREAIEYISRLHQANQEKDQELDSLRRQLGRPETAPVS